MKRNFDDINLQNAFRPIPEKCYDALMAAARSVEEERPVKRLSLKTALIAAIILLIFAAAAFAAARLFGWTDYYEQRQGISVPDAAKEALEGTKPVTCELGPMTFTFSQLLTDGHIAMSGAVISMTDGSEVLIADDSNVMEAIDSITDTVRNRYQLASGTTWIDAALETGLPLYGVRALIEPDEPYLNGPSMEDALWNANGSLSYFNLCSLNPEAVQDELPLSLYLSVIQFDPETCEPLERWTQHMSYTLSVLPVLEEKTYQPESDVCLGGLALQSIHAMRYATGVYFIASFTAPDGMTKYDVNDALHAISITYERKSDGSKEIQQDMTDGAGMPLPVGMSLSGGTNMGTFPDVSLEVMASLNELPENLILSDGTTFVNAK